ncbi:DNA ligase [Helicobacter enhydrae]|uniref:DNA ligase n=1 Tax=Helicobacter enhydrae TaxID=222136 RepID=A0A1B1U7H6_9HELI|nr:DNA ligase [Helicobacter enhydrae]
MRVFRFFVCFILATPYTLCAFELLQLAPFDPKVIENAPQNYLWSEKLDGMRAYWDGKHLYSKTGRLLDAPAFFVQGFPPFAIDGELWSKRGDFENIVSIIKSQGKKLQWRDLRFYIFEVPHQKGGLLERIGVLQQYLSQHSAPYIAIIPQHSFKDLQELHSVLEEIVAQGGEGIVLRDKHTPYYTKRNKLAMKMKKFQDKECKILSYIKGEGRFQNQVGALLCQDDQKIFKIGSGMSDEFRKNPPPIGTIITYKYFGFTKNGVPKYPTMLRIYPDFTSTNKEKQ